MRNTIMILMCLSFSVCCAQNKDIEPNFLILPADIPVPPNAKMMGTISTDSFKGCSFHRTIGELETKVLRMGGNMVKMTKYLPPTLLKDACYRFQADVYYCDTLTLNAISNDISFKIRADMPPNADYALLYIYKPKSTAGLIGSVPVKINRKKVASLKNKSGTVAKHYETGETQIKLGTLRLKINVETNKVYFIRYYDEATGFGIESTVTLMPPELGYWEYMQIER